MKKIYNEGRVVGLSSYEIYVKHHLDESPYTPYLSEMEWLSSLLGHGYGMVLKVPKVNLGSSSAVYIQIPLPENSYLRAANTIRADLFLGEGELDSSGYWLTNVTSYGPLLANTLSLHPAQGKKEPASLPQSDLLSMLSQDQIDQVKEYLSIVDGVVLQGGTWFDNPHNTPFMDLKPDLSYSPVVRLLVTQNIEKQPYILLTGFDNSTELEGMSGKDGSADPTTGSRVNGEFLGPYIYPWANKIILSYPSIASKIQNIQLSTVDQTISSGVKNYHAFVSDMSEGSRSVKSVSTVDSDNNTLLVPVTSQTDNLSENFTWVQLLDALGNKHSMNVLGPVLNALINEIPQGYISFGSGQNKTRLYISKQAPTGADIPVGSIGIGW